MTRNRTTDSTTTVTGRESPRMGVLRVLTTNDRDVLEAHGRAIEAHLPRVTTVSRCIPDHPDGIPSAAAETAAKPYIVDIATEMEDEVDVLLVSCALDPAVDRLRSSLSIPVVGAGHSTASVANAVGRRVGTLSIEGGVAPVISETLENVHHAERVDGAETTRFLTTAAGRKAIREAVDRLETAGCDVVAPSCTGLTTSGVLPELDAATPMTIVDPVLAMGTIGYVTIR